MDNEKKIAQKSTKSHAFTSVSSSSVIFVILSAAAAALHGDGSAVLDAILRALLCVDPPLAGSPIAPVAFIPTPPPPSPTSCCWNVPPRRAPFFTGINSCKLLEEHKSTLLLDGKSPSFKAWTSALRELCCRFRRNGFVVAVVLVVLISIFLVVVFSLPPSVGNARGGTTAAGPDLPEFFFFPIVFVPPVPPVAAAFISAFFIAHVVPVPTAAVVAVVSLSMFSNGDGHRGVVFPGAGNRSLALRGPTTIS